ncbi:hypothetical protein [Stenotrophomonas phage BUCT555]|nr:hypothetical protein [Stenotrophomonas phage BUCT555]
MNDMTIHHLLRLMQVKRYGIFHMNRDQSVAEHSFNVAMIALELIADEDELGLQTEVMTYALFHDMDEVLSGDIPSPFKRKLRTQCPEVIPVLDGHPKVSDKVRNIVKLADMLEAIHYCREFGGSRASDEVLEDVLMKFTETLKWIGSKVPESVIKKAKWLEQVL